MNVYIFFEFLYPKASMISSSPSRPSWPTWASWVSIQDTKNLRLLKHWETYLREAYASLRGVKGSLRGGVLFGVAYAAGYARAILSANLKKSALKQLLLDLLWLHFLVFWPFVASFPFILAFCGFISFHFGLRCLPQKCLVCVAKRSMAAFFIPPKILGAYLYGWSYQLLTRGLRGGYAALTRGELV